MDKQKVITERDKISRLLGTGREDSSLERNLFLSQAVDAQKNIIKIIDKAYSLLHEGKQDSAGIAESVGEELRQLTILFDKHQKLFSKEIKIITDKFSKDIKEIRISNTGDFKSKEIKVSNLREIRPEKQLKEISVKKPVWYKEFDFIKLVKLAKNLNEGFLKQLKAVISKVIIKNVKPREAIPVRLVTEDGDKFYRAGNVFVGGGGVDPVGLKDPAGVKINPATLGKQDEILAQLDMKISELASALEEVTVITDEWQPHFGVDTEDATHYYFGFKRAGANSWRVKRMVKADYSIAWASGASGGAAAWTGRVGLSYGEL